MKKTGKSHSVDTIFVLSLFCVFAACVLLTLMLGVRTHSAMKVASDSAYYSRTATSYITEKLRHCDVPGTVSLGEFGDGKALLLRESYDGKDYITTIYLHDGKLCELLREEGLELPPQAGEEIIEATALDFESLDNGLIKISYTDPAGTVTQAFAGLRCGGAA